MVNRLKMFPEKKSRLLCYLVQRPTREARVGEREEIRREVEEGKVPVAIYNIPKDYNVHYELTSSEV